jgi:hypothetical protein
MDTKKLGIVGLIIGIMLFVNGLVNALNSFESNMNFVDWIISDVAPSLHPQIRDYVLMLGLALFIYFFKVLGEALNNLDKYL